MEYVKWILCLFLGILYTSLVASEDVPDKKDTTISSTTRRREIYRMKARRAPTPFTEQPITVITTTLKTPWGKRENEGEDSYKRDSYLNKIDLAINKKVNRIVGTIKRKMINAKERAMDACYNGADCAMKKIKSVVYDQTENLYYVVRKHASKVGDKFIAKYNKYRVDQKIRKVYRIYKVKKERMLHKLDLWIEKNDVDEKFVTVCRFVAQKGENVLRKCGVINGAGRLSAFVKKLGKKTSEAYDKYKVDERAAKAYRCVRDKCRNLIRKIRDLSSLDDGDDGKSTPKPEMKSLIEITKVKTGKGLKNVLRTINKKARNAYDKTMDFGIRVNDAFEVSGLKGMAKNRIDLVMWKTRELASKAKNAIRMSGAKDRVMIFLKKMWMNPAGAIDHTKELLSKPERVNSPSNPIEGEVLGPEPTTKKPKVDVSYGRDGMIVTLLSDEEDDDDHRPPPKEWNKRFG